MNKFLNLIKLKINLEKKLYLISFKSLKILIFKINCFINLKYS